MSQRRLKQNMKKYLITIDQTYKRLEKQNFIEEPLVL